MFVPCEPRPQLTRIRPWEAGEDEPWDGGQIDPSGGEQIADTPTHFIEFAWIGSVIRGTDPFHARGVVVGGVYPLGAARLRGRVLTLEYLLLLALGGLLALVLHTRAKRRSVEA